MTKQELEQRQAYELAWNKLIGSEWLFPKHYPSGVDSEVYMRHFEKLTGSEFYCFRGPQSYFPSLLNKYRDNIVNSRQLFAPNGNTWLSTIVQLSPNVHIFAEWGWSKEENQHRISVSFYTHDAEDYSNFIKDNVEFEFKDSSQNFGFSGGFGGGLTPRA